MWLPKSPESDAHILSTRLYVSYSICVDLREGEKYTGVSGEKPSKHEKDQLLGTQLT